MHTQRRPNSTDILILYLNVWEAQFTQTHVYISYHTTKKTKNPLPPTWAGCHVLSKFFLKWILHFQKTYSILYAICIGRVNPPLSSICNCTESAISTAEGYQLQLPLVHQRCAGRPQHLPYFSKHLSAREQLGKRQPTF